MTPLLGAVKHLAVATVRFSKHQTCSVFQPKVVGHGYPEPEVTTPLVLESC